MWQTSFQKTIRFLNWCVGYVGCLGQKRKRSTAHPRLSGRKAHRSAAYSCWKEIRIERCGRGAVFQDIHKGMTFYSPATPWRRFLSWVETTLFRRKQTFLERNLQPLEDTFLPPIASPFLRSEDSPEETEELL